MIQFLILYCNNIYVSSKHNDLLTYRYSNIRIFLFRWRSREFVQKHRGYSRVVNSNRVNGLGTILVLKFMLVCVVRAQNHRFRRWSVLSDDRIPIVQSFEVVIYRFAEITNLAWKPSFYFNFVVINLKSYDTNEVY